MAYTPCVANIAANIAQDCAHPNVGGYTGRGVLIPIADAPVIVTDADNPRILKSITPASQKKFIAIDNVWAEAFTGSNVASSADAGRMLYNKTVSFRIPLRGAGVSKDIVEPLAQAPLGFIVVAEKKDKVGDGSYEVVGYLQGLQVNADGTSRNEYENGGDTVITMSCAEQWYECTLFDTDYATTKEAFEAMLDATI